MFRILTDLAVLSLLELHSASRNHTGTIAADECGRAIALDPRSAITRNTVRSNYD